MLGKILSFLLLLTPFSVEETDYRNVHIVDFANPTPLEEIKARYTAIDAVDGNITNKIEFVTTYNEETCEIGEYTLCVSVINSKGFVTKLDDIILVRDFTCPSVEAINPSLNFDISKDDLKELVKNNLKITDNIDKDFEIIIEDSDKIDKPGSYQIKVYVIDSSTNESNIITLTIESKQSIYEQTLDTIIEVNELNISEASIIDSFINENNLTVNYESVNLESNYLYNQSKNGTYEASITFNMDDGTCYIYNFRIVVNINEKAKPNNNYYYILIMGGLLLIGFIIYMKRR